MNGLDALSKVSGISKPEINEIWEQVKANSARLKSGVGPHDFSIEARKVGTLVRDWGCTKCGGTIESTHRSWYLKGLEHGESMGVCNSGGNKP